MKDADINNRELPMAYRLWKNEARRLLRKVLVDMRHCSECDLLLDPEHKAGSNLKTKYWNGNNQGKLLNEIDDFLNKRASLMD